VKPQLIGLGSEGVHNADIRKSTARVIQGASWKKQRTAMLIPAGQTIPSKVYLSHCSLIFPPNQGAHRMLAMGMEVGEAFSNAIAEILAHPELSQWEYLLTIEHDNCPPIDGLVRLIQRMEEHPEFSCIGGLYWTKGEGGVPQIWGDIKDPVQNFRPQPPDPNGGLVECWGTGMGFNLWRLKMFKDERLRRPWFKTVAGIEGVGTQDLYFWADARKYGYRCAIDCSVKVGHYDMDGKFGPPDTMW
jgi:hypothetical protein